jgi:hypothetical protein
VNPVQLFVCDFKFGKDSERYAQPVRFSQYTLGVVFRNTFDRISLRSANSKIDTQITIIITPEPAASSGAGHFAAAENNVEQTRPTYRDRASYFEI